MPVETERVTIRLPVSDLAALDAFVQSGEYMNRSDVIRDAIRDFVRSRAKEVAAGVDARKTLIESVQNAQALKDMRETFLAKFEELEELKKLLK
ncbi:MAG TPA: ribbon-helix-helix domain-containing protein [Candidatus Thermoplasmatota archaeon]|nr:ribbon-helix-helix domain-containing protein [Candidatus Thermoplasmatota archaeon]